MSLQNIDSYPRVTEIINAVIAKDPKLIDYLIEQERKGIDTRKSFKQAGTKGTKLHDLCKRYLEGEDLKLKNKALENKVSLVGKMKGNLTLINSEYLMHTDTPFNHKGTLDYIFSDENKNLILVDLKTGKPKFKWSPCGWMVIPRPEHCLQLHGYKYLYESFVPGSCISEMRLWYLLNTDIHEVKIPYVPDLWQCLLKLYAWLYL